MGGNISYTCLTACIIISGLTSMGYNYWYSLPIEFSTQVEDYSQILARDTVNALTIVNSYKKKDIPIETKINIAYTYSYCYDTYDKKINKKGLDRVKKNIFKCMVNTLPIPKNRWYNRLYYKSTISYMLFGINHMYDKEDLASYMITSWDW